MTPLQHAGISSIFLLKFLLSLILQCWATPIEFGHDNRARQRHSIKKKFFQWQIKKIITLEKHISNVNKKLYNNIMQ